MRGWHAVKLTLHRLVRAASRNEFVTHWQRTVHSIVALDVHRLVDTRHSYAKLIARAVASCAHEQMHLAGAKILWSEQAATLLFTTVDLVARIATSSCFVAISILLVLINEENFVFRRE